MSYSRKVYVKAASTLERRRSKAEHTQSMHREEAYAKIPELISIDREISSAGAEVIRAIGMGENAQRFIEELSKKNLAAQQRRKDILKENGYPEDYLDADYTCKKCRDTGFIRAHARLSRASMSIIIPMPQTQLRESTRGAG